MIKIGITGGIGSGKSIVSKLLEVLGIPVYIADVEAKKIVTLPDIKKKLTNAFGKMLYINGELDKAYLASIIFNDKKSLQQVNSIIHPEVKKDFITWAEYQQKEMVGIESAILYEAGFEKEVDCIITVTAPLAIRIFRVMKRNNLSQEQVKDRINNQLSNEEKAKHANFIIINDDKRSVIPQVLNIVQQLSCLPNKY